MELDDDLRSLMLLCLDIEKRAVQEDLEEYGCALVIYVRPTGRAFEHVDFTDEESKICAYTDVVRKAKATGTTALITVNAARTTTGPYTEDDVDSYWWGKLAAEGSRECISITASGPGMKSFGLNLAYEVVSGEVRFDPSPVIEETIIGMLPDWPDAPPTAVV